MTSQPLLSIEIDADVREPLFATVSEFNGKNRLDVRHYWRNKEGQLCPGKSGINMPVAEIQNLIDALETVKNELLEQGSLAE